METGGKTDEGKRVSERKDINGGDKNKNEGGSLVWRSPLVHRGSLEQIQILIVT